MKKKRRAAWTAGVLAVIAAAIVIWAVPFSGRARADEREDSIRSITETVQKMALQCYVIEGAYPEGLEYLQENYGLTVNTEEYLIIYTPYAENLPPEVQVIWREEDK